MLQPDSPPRRSLHLHSPHPQSNSCCQLAASSKVDAKEGVECATKAAATTSAPVGSSATTATSPSNSRPRVKDETRIDVPFTSPPPPIASSLPRSIAPSTLTTGNSLDLTPIDKRIRRTRQVVLGCFIINLCVIGVVCGMLVKAIWHVQSAFDSFDRLEIRDVDLSLLHLRRSINEAEASAFGFVITGDESYLTTFNRHRPHFTAQTQELIDVTTPNTYDRGLSLKISDLTAQRCKQLDQMVAARRTNGFEAARSQLINDGSTVMKDLVSRLDELMSRAKQHSHQLQSDSRHSLSVLWVYFGVNIAIIFLSLLLSLLSTSQFNTGSLKKQNETLQQLLHKAEESTKLKSQFLANISHEIRTPMNGVSAMSHLLSTTELNPDQRECVETIIESSNSMLNLLNDLLLCSKIGCGKFTLNPGPFRLLSMIRHVEGVMRSRLEHKGRQIREETGVTPALRCEVNSNSIAPDLVIIADSDRIKQILLNLLDNSFKFTSEGCITLTVRLASCQVIAPRSPMSPSSPRQLRDCNIHGNEISCVTDAASSHLAGIQFTVTDTGIGIPEEAQKKIFEAFSQADMSTTKKYGGSGLGLTVCSELVREMGSSIGVKSSDGKGSTFEFVLCVPTATAEQVPRTETPVENAKTLTPRLAAALTRISTRSSVSTSSHQQQSSASSDTNAPVRSAASSIETRASSDALDEQKFTDGSICLQPQTTVDHVQLPTENGASSSLIVVPTPIQPTPTASPPIVPPTTPFSSIDHLPLRILCAEDNKINQKVIRKILTREGYSVVMADNGQIALDLFRDHRREFDCVLLDMMMPVMDGTTACRMMRQLEQRWKEERVARCHQQPASTTENEHKCTSLSHPQLTGSLEADSNTPTDLAFINHIPIIAVTASALLEDKKICVEAGMDDVITKPLTPSTLLRVLRAILRLRTSATPNSSTSTSSKAIF